MTESNGPKVRITKSGKIVWESADVRNQEIKKHLEAIGYNVKISEIELGKKFYVARRPSVAKPQVEHSFATMQSVDKHFRERNKYAHNDEILYRENIAHDAAMKLLELYRQIDAHKAATGHHGQVQ